eukprot:3940858-Rhodomonas_salina.2
MRTRDVILVQTYSRSVLQYRTFRGTNTLSLSTVAPPLARYKHTLSTAHCPVQTYPVSQYCSPAQYCSHQLGRAIPFVSTGHGVGRA